MEYLFYLSAPLLLISGIPQTIRLLKRKSSEDISIITYLCTWIAVSLLVLNSIQNGNMSLIVANGVSMITLTLNLFLALKYRNDICLPSLRKKG